MKFYNLLYIISLIVITLGTLFLFGYMHERVHVEIYRSYGIESHVEYFSHFPDLVTIVDNSSQYFEKCNSYCKLANNLNEVVGYPLIVILFIILIFGFIIILEIKRD